MNVRAHLVLEDCIRRGVELGWRRAHQYFDQPSASAIKAAIQGAISTEISQYFHFDDDPDQPEDAP